MGIIEAFAIIILVLAVLVLAYYYLQNNPVAIDKIKTYVPSNTLNNNDNFDFDDEFEDKESMGKKIKVKLSDIDMSSFNTDLFSKKIDAFLDEKSDELIQNWELATKADLSELEERFDSTTNSLDSLEKKFNTFKDDSNKKFDDFESRIEKLEKN